MKKTLLIAAALVLIFFAGTWAVIGVDTICFETTGHGGKLVLDVENIRLFN